MNYTASEMEKLQFEMMTKPGANRRIEPACEMFAAARKSIIATCGEHLPQDFFKDG